jgi:hypothetical protein
MTLLTPNTIPCQSIEEAQRRLMLLYRQWLRDVPFAAYGYPLNIPLNQLRTTVRRTFDRYQAMIDVANDLSVINRALLKSSMDLIEMRLMWKQRSHMQRLFQDVEVGSRLTPPVPRFGDANAILSQTINVVDRAVIRKPTPFLKSFLANK